MPTFSSCFKSFCWKSKQYWTFGLVRTHSRRGQELHWFLKSSALAADVGAGFCKIVAGNRSDGSSELVSISCHRELKLIVNGQVFEQLPDLGVDPVEVVEDVPGLADQGRVGVAHAQPEAGHHVQQGTKLTGFLELIERFTNSSVRQMHLGIGIWL